jgi:hypothetical protein
MAFLARVGALMIRCSVKVAFLFPRLADRRYDPPEGAGRSRGRSGLGDGGEKADVTHLMQVNGV